RGPGRALGLRTGGPEAGGLESEGRRQAARNLRPEGRRADAGWMSRPVRRVLSRTAIHLGPTLPQASSDLPGSSGGQPSGTSCLVLLRVGFTEPHRSPGALVVSYTTVSPLPPGTPDGGLLSVALSRGSPRVGVTHHPALWSPDVPRCGSPRNAAAWPTHPPLQSTGPSK